MCIGRLVGLSVCGGLVSWGGIWLHRNIHHNSLLLLIVGACYSVSTLLTITASHSTTLTVHHTKVSSLLHTNIVFNS